VLEAAAIAVLQPSTELRGGSFDALASLLNTPVPETLLMVSIAASPGLSTSQVAEPTLCVSPGVPVNFVSGTDDPGLGVGKHD